ncbi:hypothetical protein LAZ67_4001743 [Cordylochernes scorpioides]|uniref:Reverse transcriptase/retrotransposon-derived protein RNase H-like domain-containing protein n=1 Tax=Cordylochernes scorpioides TaxID=51811 RepID=A0ABY6KD03_9ARAC|nr:hypothetical protein LAZ67_4001743 [Cordylochernes scorpioides]
MERLEKVLKCIQRAGLCLNPEKCRFGSKIIKVLGHLVSEEDIRPDPGKIEAIINFPTPKNTTDVRGFIGLCSYYRRFVRNFANKAKPLHELLKNNTRFVWSKEQDESFQILKAALTTDPLLGHYKEEAETHLHTDASGHGIGAILIQIHEGEEKPIAYASRTLNAAEKNYSTTERECLAVVWAIYKFRPYLFGRHFTRVGIDLLGRFPVSNNGNKWIVVATDYLSRYAMTRAIPNGSAEEVAKFMIEDLIDLCGTIHRFTSAYHPQTNGLTERLNKTLADMLSINWDAVLPYATFAYNTSQQESTGFSPFYLIHGRDVETPLDTILAYRENTSLEDYVESMVTNSEDARQLARLNILRSQERDKSRYDQSHRPVHYQTGDLVWVFTPVRRQGLAEKLLKRYFGPYRVNRQLSEVTYEVEPLEKRPRQRKNKRYRPCPADEALSEPRRANSGLRNKHNLIGKIGGNHSIQVGNERMMSTIDLKETILGTRLAIPIKDDRAALEESQEVRGLVALCNPDVDTAALQALIQLGGLRDHHVVVNESGSMLISLK